MTIAVKLHFGDNLEWLKRQPDASVDLCYIDPPFNSKADYNVIIGGAQMQAFTDTWGFGIDDMKVQMALQTLGEERIANWAKGMLITIGHCGMLSYLLFMAERLLEIRRVLKPTGSIYVHCDQAADYHLRLLMDAVFGPENFRNEIVWCYTGPANVRSHFPRKHDTVLVYAISDTAIFNRDAVRIPYKEGSFTMGGGGSLAAKNRLGDYKTGAAEQLARGKIVEDYWTDIPSLSVSSERVGYPTQKPLALLERIIAASSNPGDTVMDCFLGSGTTAVAATKLGRDFIGCDIAFPAVDIAIHRLEALDPQPEITVTGHPKTIEDAHELARRDKFQFQAWALDMVGCNPTGAWTAKKGSDGGIDGKMVTPLKDGSTYVTVVSVKAGKPRVADVRDLIGTVVKENAQRGLLLMLDEPTTDMVTTAAAVGINGYSEPRCVILSAQDLLDGKRPHTVGEDKDAPRHSDRD